MITIRVKITRRDGSHWYASSRQVKSTPERTVQYLNLLAKNSNLGSTYELVTEDEYWAYRCRVRAEIEDFTFAVPVSINVT